MKAANKERLAGIINATEILLCIILVAAAFIVFFSEEDNLTIFPLVFLLASILKFLYAFSILSVNDGKRSRRIKGILELVFGMTAFLVFIISVFSVWL